MSRLRSDSRSSLGRVLKKARDLAEQVRETAERVHREALEAHRLTEIARRQSERGRELSRAGQKEARAVKDSIDWSLDTAQRTGRRLAGKDED